jgi:hypothetical protein
LIASGFLSEIEKPVTKTVFAGSLNDGLVRERKERLLGEKIEGGTALSALTLRIQPLFNHCELL